MQGVTTRPMLALLASGNGVHAGFDHNQCGLHDEAEAMLGAAPFGHRFVLNVCALKGAAAVAGTGDGRMSVDKAVLRLYFLMLHRLLQPCAKDA